MSHFTRIQTQLTEERFLLQALRSLGYLPEQGRVAARGFAGNQTQVDIRIRPTERSHDIGFRKVGNRYEIVADWWGITGTTEEQFVRDLTQRYAYHAAREKLEAQGFALASETVAEGGQIHLVLRRMV